MSISVGKLKIMVIIISLLKLIKLVIIMVIIKENDWKWWKSIIVIDYVFNN